MRNKMALDALTAIVEADDAQCLGQSHIEQARAAIAALQAEEVERLAAQAASAPAVRMLTEDEVAQAAEDGERSFRRWTQGVRGQTLMPQDSPTFHYVMAGAAKALAVNAGKHIPADGKIGGV